MLAKRLLMLAGTPWHKYLEDRQWKCLQKRKIVSTEKYIVGHFLNMYLIFRLILGIFLKKKCWFWNICNGMVKWTTTTSVPKLLSSDCVVDKGLLVWGVDLIPSEACEIPWKTKLVDQELKLFISKDVFFDDNKTDVARLLNINIESLSIKYKM